MQICDEAHVRIFSPAASFRAYAAAGPAGRAHRPFRFRLSVRQLASPSYFSPQPARSEDGVCVFPPLRVHQISIIKSASPNYAFCEKPTRSGGVDFFLRRSHDFAAHRGRGGVGASRRYRLLLESQKWHEVPRSSSCF